MTRPNRLMRGLIPVALLAGLLAGLAGPHSSRVRAASNLQATPGIVVSEFRTLGPGGGDDELIELYNPTPKPANISGWSLKASNNIGTTINLATIPTGTVLAPGQYYLLANFGGYTGLTVPDQPFTASFPDRGGIGLLDQNQNVVDAVGTDTGSAYQEPPVLAPLTGTADQSYERKPGGNQDSCTDTNNNRNDFTQVISDPRNSASPRSLCGTLVESTTTRVLSHNPHPSVVGERIVVQYTVTAASGIPGGNVTVRSGADTCTATVAAGQCSLKLTSAGNRNLTARYAGQGTFAPSTSAAVQHTVNKAATRTIITADTPKRAGVGQPVLIKFRVSVRAPGSGTPTGTVTVTGGGVSCTASVAAGGCSLTFTTRGKKNLKAAYSGDTDFVRSTSAARQITVGAAATATPFGYNPTVMINEIAWSGTAASAADEWIELYNNTDAPIDLTGWRLRAGDFTPSITLNQIIPARGYYLLERVDNQTVSDIAANQIYQGEELEDTGESLYLYNAGGFIQDYANAVSFSWLAGSATNHRSMERRGVFVDSRTTWVTNTGVVRNGKDADGNAINGTPKNRNWAITVTLTPSRKPTIIPSRTQPPQPRPVINEFLPRAAFDWNKDGRVDVFDEFIEIANLGPVDVNLQGWKLDDAANGGSAPFPLPNTVLKPGERLLLYGLQSNILLSDGGDTVRLLNPSNVIFDSQTYPVVKVADQSWCRLPDQRGSWYSDCFPTPNLANERRGQLPSRPPGTGLEEPLCLLADTLTEEFILAECRGFGAQMWSASYWDKNGWNGDLPILQNGSKWESFVQ